MKKFLTIVFFCLPAFGQAAYSGPGLDSGPAAYGAPVSGGAPLTYSARSDNCVTGVESGCIGGTTTGEAGSAMSFLGRVTDTAPVGLAETTITSGSCPSGVTPTNYPASCVAPMNATATDPDFGTYEVMLTDDYTAVGSNPTNPWSQSWAVSDSKGFSPEETLIIVVNQNGGLTLLNFNPASLHAKTCATSPCVSQTGLWVAGSGHGDSTHFAHNADLAASSTPSENYTFYERDNLLLNKLVVTSSIASPGTASMARTVYADFVNGTGSYGGVLPPIVVGSCTSNYATSWVGIWARGNAGAVGFMLDGGYDWCPSWTPADAIGNTTFIMPSLHNPANHGYQWTGGSGVTGLSAAEPVWNGAGCTSYTVGATCADNTGSWVDIGNITGQGPGFDIVQYTPTLGYSRMNTRLGKIYRGSGNSAPAGLITTNDPAACTRVLGAPCGTGVTVNLPDEYTLHDGNQNRNDAYFEISPTGAEANNAPGNWNSGTLTCQNSGASAVWAGAWSSSTTYTSNKTVSYTDTGTSVSAYYVATSHASNLNQIPSSGGTVNTTYWTQSEAYCPYYYWTIATTLVQPTTAWTAASGHSAGGYLYHYLDNNYYATRRDQPSTQLSPPNGPITLNPGTALISATIPGDFHGTYGNGDLGDHQPVFAGTIDVPSNTIRDTAACYDEICAFANVVTGASAKTYRFGHNYNSGCNAFFQDQNSVPSISPLGDILMFGTDLWGMRNVWGGSTPGGVAGNNLCEAQKAQSGILLNIGDRVFPISSNAGNYVYITTTAGTTNGSAPTGGWCQTSCSSPQQWGTAYVQNNGQNNGRADLMAIDLLSAQPAP